MHPMGYLLRFAVVFPVVSYLSVSAAPAGAGADHVVVRDKPPFYVGKLPPPSRSVGHLGVRLGPSFAELGGVADWEAATAEFLEQCGGYLDSLGVQRIAPDTAAGIRPPAPALYVGDPGGFYAPMGLLSDEERARYGRTAVVVYASDPPGKEKRAVESLAAAAEVDFVLYLRLDLSDYPVTQKNLKGSKVVSLGTGYQLPVPWLTTLDQPVEVLQFTGALYRADGKFIRAGAEAFYALRTPFGESALGVQRAIKRGDLSQILESRRGDLPGEPLAWHMALNNLVAQLAGWKDQIVPETP